MKRLTLTLAALSLVAGAAGPALSAPTGEPARLAVPTAGLDLATPEGKATLHRRLAHAAAELCGEASASDPAGRRAVRACRSEAVAAAEREVAARRDAARLAQR